MDTFPSPSSRSHHGIDPSVGEQHTVGLFNNLLSHGAARPPDDRQPVYKYHEVSYDFINITIVIIIKYLTSLRHMNFAANYTNSNGRRGFGAVTSVQSELEEAVHHFFVQLFPVAYHQMVHLNKEHLGELHEDYINCLQHNFEELRPFKDIPRQLQASLGKSVHMSNVFLNALLQAAEVLSEADALYGEQLSDSCKMHLLKMYYCPNCNGHHSRTEAKLCDGYCKNVMRWVSEFSCIFLRNMKALPEYLNESFY